MNIEEVKRLCPEFAELLEMESKISKAPWHTVDQIWLPRGCDTYVISGHYDPHVGRPVFSDYGDNDDIEWPEIAANCEFTVKVRNELIPLITALAEPRQALESQKEIVDAAIEWQSYWADNTWDRDGIYSRQGYLYNKVNRYKALPTPPSVKEGS